MLLLADAEPVSASRLVAAVWADHNGQVSKGSVQVGVSRLRAWLRRTAGADSAESIEHVGDGYRLATAPDAVDLQRLRQASVEAAELSDPVDRYRVLRSALALRRGPVLVDLTTLDAAAPLLAAARQDVRAGALAFGCAAVAVGRPEEALGHVEAEAAAAPFDEPVHACLIDLLVALERPAEALLSYERLRSRLADELGVAPSEAVQRAYLAVLGRDVYLHRNGPDAERAVPAQLPMAVTGFTGRSHELAQLDALLADDDGPTAVVISAVSGTAGVGKTALAVHWANRVRDRFPDGQLYINLRGYDPDQPVTAAGALNRFLISLGVPAVDLPPDVEDRATRFRTLTAGRRMLILLDNASSVEQVRPLLPGDPSCGVVVTSRDSLAGLVAMHGANRVELDLLPTSDAVALLRGLIGPRVDAEPEPAAILADQCSRLPLALRIAAELAAAHPRTPLRDLVRDLGDQHRRLDLLDAGGDPRAAVRAVFSWSYRHLPPEAARTFALLGRHPGPDTDPYAVAALIDASVDCARDTLDLLARAHLVHAAGPGRYAMHDLLRAYAASLDVAIRETDETRAALSRLFDYYLATAAVAADTLYPAEAHHRPHIARPVTPAPALDDPDTARAWLDAERPCLAAVAVHAAAHGWPGHAVRLSSTLFSYLAGGHCTYALTIHTHAHRAAQEAGDPAGHAQALLGLGAILWQTGQYEPAASHLRQGLALFRQVGDQIGEARALGNLGSVDGRLGRYRSAAEHHTQALALFRQAGDCTGEATALTNLGDVEERLGQYDSAAAHHSRSLALFRRAGNRVGEAFALNNLGDVEQRLGRYDLAVEHHDQSLAVFQQLGNRAGAAWTLVSLGDVHTRLGRADQAAAHHQQALTVFREIGERLGQARALNGLGTAATSSGRPTDAVAHHTAALESATETGDRDQQAHAHSGLGDAHALLADPNLARGHYERALALYSGLESLEAGNVRAQLAVLS
jgi:tetratricopeptide (TPR) repeat protein/DNA-binding SARP family transcriptional activator